LEVVNFFKGLAALRNPDGSAEVAENFLGALQQRHPEVAGYTVDLLAARIAQLLRSDLFARLRGDDVIRGRKALGEAEASMLQARDVTAAEKETFDCNRALPLLALGRPDEANEALARTVPVRLRDRIAAYTAVELARMGRSAEASDVLLEAERLSGKTRALEAAEGHIATGKRFPADADTLDDTPGGDVRDILFQMLQMEPVQQAAIYVNEPEPLEKLITKLVRTASGRVTHLASTMTGVTIDSCEDDLNSLLGEILSA
jgi:hypothetical protein